MRYIYSSSHRQRREEKLFPQHPLESIPSFERQRHRRNSLKPVLISGSLQLAIDEGSKFQLRLGASWSSDQLARITIHSLYCSRKVENKTESKVKSLGQSW